MRLTLRTLLAYRDRVLSATDMEDLHHRIQKSDIAGNLLRRIDAVSSDANLSALPPSGTGLGVDANTVAEYLDDALANNEIPEFEKVTLVSNVHLAELAQCHALLSAALSTNVPVDDKLRAAAMRVGSVSERPAIADEILIRRGLLKKKQRRAGSLSKGNATDVTAKVVATVVETQHNSSAASAEGIVHAPMVASGGDSIKHEGLDLEGARLHHEVPEYLLGTNRIKWGAPLAIVAVGLTLILLVWQTLGPWERISKLLVAESTPKPVAETQDAETVLENDAVRNGPSEDHSDNAAVADSTAAASDTMVPLANEPSAVETVAPAESDNSPSLARPESAASPAELGSEQSPDLQLAMESAVRWSPLPGTESDGAVLLDRETQLTRATAEQNVPVGARIVVPASTRTTLQLDDGMEWLTCGPSILVPEGLLSDEQTNQDEPQGDNRVAISSPLCRGILVSTKAGRSLRMATPFQSLDIDFGGAGSRISLEVTYRPETHGSILDRDAFKPILVIVVLEGDVQITSKTDGKSMAVALGQGFASVSGQEPRLFKIESIPPWLRSETERPVDVVAARDLSMMLAAAPDANLRNQLAALTQHRRPETAAAAIQLELLLSNFNPFVDSLSNARMRAHWQRTIEIARQALASDPQLSQACEVAFRNKYGEGPGVQLFKLLCGPTGGEIDDGVIAKLISELESPRLEYRVLAAYQLHELTGQTLGFQPHAPERLSVQAWRRENAAEKLPLLDLIDLIWERVP